MLCLVSSVLSVQATFLAQSVKDTYWSGKTSCRISHWKLLAIANQVRLLLRVLNRSRTFYRLWIQLFICKWTTKLYFLAFNTQCAINQPAGVCQFRFVRQLPSSLSDISSYYIYSWMLQRPVTKWNIALSKITDFSGKHSGRCQFGCLSTSEGWNVTYSTWNRKHIFLTFAASWRDKYDRL